MNSNPAICIYCKTNDPNQFTGVEHVVPQSFGKFGTETPTLKCVCDGCNSFFGNGLDRNLARQTIEGLTRYAKGTFSKGRQPQRKVKTVLATNEENGQWSGAKVTIDPQTGKMDLAPQFVIQNLLSGEFEAYELAEIDGLHLPENCYGALGRDGQKGNRNCKVLAFTRAGGENVVSALNRNGIEFKPGEQFGLPGAEPQGGVGPPPSFEVEMTAEIDDLHKRAVAKILMNFAAKYLGCDEVLTSKWDFVRDFVRYGKGAMPARLSSRPFWTGQETEIHRFADDSFNIRLENIEGHVVGVLQFYGHDSFELVLIENQALPADQEIAYRFTPGSKPIPGEKRPVGAS